MGEFGRVPEIRSDAERSIAIGTSAETFFTTMEQYIPDPKQREGKYHQILVAYKEIAGTQEQAGTTVEEKLRALIDSGRLQGTTILIDSRDPDTTTLSDKDIHEGLGLDN